MRYLIVLALTIMHLLGQPVSVNVESNNVPAVQTPVPVCLCCIGGRVQLTTIGLARFTVSKIFTPAGIVIAWQSPNRACPVGAIQIRLSEDRPLNFLPNAFAYANPSEGTIEVFVDRVLAVKNVRTPVILGHVLAHEIVHILQGASRHSDAGLMKAHWGWEEYSQMRRESLSLGNADVLLIRAGLEKDRQRQLSRIAAH